MGTTFNCDSSSHLLPVGGWDNCSFQTLKTTLIMDEEKAKLLLEIIIEESGVHEMQKPMNSCNHYDGESKFIWLAIIKAYELGKESSKRK
jgi:hypothetical protein